MLAPNDVAATEQSLGRTIDAATAVTIYAAAMRFQVSPLLELPLPQWFDPIKANLLTAIEHARNWQDILCGRIAIDVPQGFIDYNTVFQPTSDQLINLVTEIEMSGQGASDDQRQQVGALLGTLRSHLDDQATTLRTLHGSVVGLMDAVQQDHTTILNAAATVEQEIPGAGVITKKIQAELGNDFFDTQIAGTCSVSLSVKESIDVQIKETAGSHTELLPYVIAQAVLGKAQTDNEAATRALSGVVTQWQLLQDLLQDVVTDLNKADSNGVLPILEKLDIQSAQGVWTQLQEFASRLTDSQESS